LKILTAEFVTSVGPTGEFLLGNRPSLALVGRSNVGKSSVINALARRRIARAGGRPGTTRLVNIYHLRVSVPATGAHELALIDLPGYGYARGGDSTREAFDALTERFFARVSTSARRSAAGHAETLRLAGVVLLLDVRHPGLVSDVDAAAWIAERGFPLIVVATKVDRLSRSAGRTAVETQAQVLGCPVLPVSAKTGRGIDQLWRAAIDLL
jgi:GTP-binding protein